VSQETFANPEACELIQQLIRQTEKLLQTAEGCRDALLGPLDAAKYAYDRACLDVEKTKLLLNRLTVIHTVYAKWNLASDTNGH
jgi:hypothetical protein